MGVVVRQSLKGTFVNYIGVVLGIFVQFYIVAKYLDPEVIGLSKVVYEVAFLLSTLALFGSGREDGQPWLPLLLSALSDNGCDNHHPALSCPACPD